MCSFSMNNEDTKFVLAYSTFTENNSILLGGTKRIEKYNLS